MKYYLDTEFHEYKKQPKVLGLNIGKPIDTIELISVGIVAEDGREYYAISKDFNLKEAWNRYQIEDTFPDSLAFGKIKKYWIRENVLKSIFLELLNREVGLDEPTFYERTPGIPIFYNDFRCVHLSFKELKRLINKYGKSNEEISNDIKDFISQKQLLNTPADDFAISELKSTYEGRMEVIEHKFGKPEFYAYYADYDWVVFCWLFGRMIDLPKGFPMYCRDLKQELDDAAKRINDNVHMIKVRHTYPKQENEHNAVEDARWNKKLHEFINKL